jgi:hypothetical protein
LSQDVESLSPKVQIGKPGWGLKHLAANDMESRSLTASRLQELTGAMILEIQSKDERLSDKRGTCWISRRHAVSFVQMILTPLFPERGDMPFQPSDLA